MLPAQRNGTTVTPVGRVRVLWVIKGLGVGGAERLLTSLAGVADHERFDYEVAYLLPWKDALAGDLRSLGVAVHCLDARHERDLRWLVRFRRMLTARRYDIVHLHSPYVAGWARLVVQSMPRRRRPRVLSTEHNVWWSYVAPTRILNAITAPLDDARVAVSSEVRESIPSPLRRSVRVVVHGVRLDAIPSDRAGRTRLRASLGIGDDTVVALTVANFRPQKGHLDLLDAARRVVASGVDVTFLLVGHGPLEPDVRDAHEALQLGDRVRFLGFRDDAVELLAASDMFVLASLHEGFPVAVMEALAAGVPVVATAVGGVPDVIDDGVEGYIVPAGHPEELAAAIVRVADDPAGRERMSEAAAARGREFDIARAAREIESLYRDLVQR